ncbi:MAG TPA: hypothetical protein VFQ61_31570, partial [Polyangiaceae bacterium]|nr:hypothetical protein [Polyangiaceae bacterium]
MNGPVVGKGLDRADARLKVTGKAQYAAEVPAANLTYVVIVSSQVGKGRVTKVETGAAERH